MRPLLLFTISFARIAALVASVCLATAAYTQTITTFDPPNSTGTYPQDINALGQVTGYDGVHGFLRNPDGAIITFDIPVYGQGPISTVPTSINQQGEITGYFSDGFSFYRGFLRHTDGTLTIFDSFGSTASAAIEPYPFSDGTLALDNNSAGQITGFWGGAVGGGRWHGFLRQPDGTVTSFEAWENSLNFISSTWPLAINSAGQITGHYQDATGDHGFLRDSDGTIIRFDPPNASTHPRAINSAGAITANYGNLGFLRKANGKIVTFNPIGSSYTQPNSINRSGKITGYYLGADGTYHGFLRNKNGKFETFDAPGAGTGNSRGTFPQAIGNGGEITGYYQDANFVVHGFVRSK